MSLIRGKHSLKFGGQYHYRNFYTNTANPMNGDAIFGGTITNFPMADALLGYPSEVRRGAGDTLTDSISHYYLGSYSRRLAGQFESDDELRLDVPDGHPPL